TSCATPPSTAPRHARPGSHPKRTPHDHQAGPPPHLGGLRWLPPTRRVDPALHSPHQPDMKSEPPVQLYLASTSPARLATLRAAGVEPVIIPSEVDENAAVAAAGVLAPTELVQLLARLKAEAITSRDDAADIDGFILGGDSAFELDGVIYGKPHT